MRRLVPDGRSVDLTDAYEGLVPPATWVAIGMVTSVDGATAVDGVSGGLGGAGDLAAFRALRSLADVVVVGAGTAVAEEYRPRIAVRHGDARVDRGQAPRPRLALVTGSGQLDPSSRLFRGGDEDRPLVLTTAAGADELAGRGVDAEVVTVGDGSHVPPGPAVEVLHARGLHRIVVEGGPTLNAAWLGAGVVDELFVTVSPLLVGGDGPGLAGPLDGAPVELDLLELRVHGAEVVLRYRVGPSRYGPDADEDG